MTTSSILADARANYRRVSQYLLDEGYSKDLIARVFEPKERIEINLAPHRRWISRLRRPTDRWSADGLREDRCMTPCPPYNA